MNKRNSPRSLPTLFKNLDDQKEVILTCVRLLEDKVLEANSDGFASIDQLLERVKKEHPSITYLNRNHIVELYFKEKDRRILIRDTDGICYKDIRYVQPPDTLYFGTLTNIAQKMLVNGIRSSSKGYLKLYDRIDLAVDFARKFVTRDDDRIAVIEVNASKAFSEGLKFSTYKEGQFIAVRMQPKYLKGIAHETQPLRPSVPDTDRSDFSVD